MPVIKCDKVACYNQGNERECWTAIHPDGKRSYEWASEAEAAKWAEKPYEAVSGAPRAETDEEGKPVVHHVLSWC